MIRSALKVALEKIHYTLGNTLERRWNTNPFGSSPGTREFDVLREEAVAQGPLR